LRLQLALARSGRGRLVRGSGRPRLGRLGFGLPALAALALTLQLLELGAGSLLTGSLDLSSGLPCPAGGLERCLGARERVARVVRGKLLFLLLVLGSAAGLAGRAQGGLGPLEGVCRHVVLVVFAAHEPSVTGISSPEPVHESRSVAA
jgi:hypothetical protein